jgi:hypothetical protein
VTVISDATPYKEPTAVVIPIYGKSRVSLKVKGNSRVVIRHGNNSDTNKNPEICSVFFGRYYYPIGSSN